MKEFINKLNRFIGIRKNQSSILIDKFIIENKDVTVCFNGIWYIAKPLGKNYKISRIIGAWRVLTGKSIGVHYKEDE